MFGVCNSIKSREVRECTPEVFYATVHAERVEKVCAEIEDARERLRRGELAKEEYDAVKSNLKKQLPIFTPHALFRNGRRCNDEAIPSGLSMYDIDHIADPRGYFEGIREIVPELGIVLVHVTPSLEGLRFFFIIPEGMGLAEAQEWMSFELGDRNYDASVKDYARSSFVVPEDYILYINEKELFKDRKCEKIDNHGSECRGPECRDAINRVSTVATVDTPNSPHAQYPTAFKGIPYTRIIEAWFRLMGGEPQPGERNSKLHHLATHLRHITDNDEEHLLQVMPRYGLGEEEMRGLIHSACTSKFYAMPKLMQAAIDVARPGCRDAINRVSTGNDAGNDTPPPMPATLPQLIKLLTSRTPEIYKPAVAHAVFPPLAAHLWRVRFRYINNREHEATLMNVLMAGTGAGKDCITEPIDHIMADIRQRDEQNLRRERAWKDEINTKGANKDKRKRPGGLVIQEIDADMTNPAFVMRMAEADGRFLYTKLNELDQFDALKGGFNGMQHFRIMCLAFDPQNRYGQTRVGTQSVTEKVTIRFNWNASTTVWMGKRYFAKVLVNGPLSRINFCTIPEREIGSEMPVYGTYGPDFDDELRPYIERLVQASGLVDCPEAFRLARLLREECAEHARALQSRIYENFSFRANVIAYLKACVLYVANGCRWEAAMEEFIRWSLQYDLWCKMEFFGDAIAAAEHEETEKKQRSGPANLLDSLPEEFTVTDVEAVRLARGMDTKGARHMISQWIYRKYVSQITDHSYKKLKTS